MSQQEKIRVYEYAKSLNMSSREILTILKRMNVPVANHMSVMEPEAIEAVERFFREVKANAAAKRAAQALAEAEAKARAAVETSAPPKPAVDENRRRNGQAAATPQMRAKPQPSGAAQKPNVRPPASQPQQQPQQQTQPQSQPQSQQHGQDRQAQPDRAQAQQRPDRRHDRDRRPAASGGQPQKAPAATVSSQGGRPDQRPDGRHDQRPDRRHGPSREAERGADRAAAGRPPKPQGPQQQAGRSERSPDGAGRRDRPRDGRPRFGGNRLEAQLKKVFESTPVAKQDARNVAKSAKHAKHDADLDDVKTRKGFDRFEEEFKDRLKPSKGKGSTSKKADAAKAKADTLPKKIIVKGPMTVGEFAKTLHRDLSEVIKKLMALGIMATINQELDLDAIQLVCAEFGVEVDLRLPVEEEKFELLEETDDPADLKPRPPVVTVMGHVDHGKTTLLDAIRHTNVTASEAGGITQHIGAYQVEVGDKKITFLDTPGHEAFTSMRARGAKVTDITVLVVAADDGVMPQTVEAINHAKAANVPIIVAVNKIDKPEANPDKIRQDLTAYGLVPEEWGGDTIFVNISAKQKIGLDHLLDMILLVAEVQELKANPNKRARGTVLEAELDKGKGPVARVLVQNGTLKVGDVLVAGTCFGRVRAMTNDRGRRVKEAGPSTPVEITGLTDVPLAGDPFMVFEDERKARAIAEKRAAAQRQTEMVAQKRVTLDELYKQIQEGSMKELNVILKADVQGSVEALRSSLEKIDVEGVRVRILHAAVGAITESDITLASASNAIIIGFNVRPEPSAKQIAEREKVDIRLHNVIYKAIEEIEAAMKGMLEPEYRENVLGRAEVRNLFRISKVGTVAGCMVIEGKVVRGAQARLIRDGVVVHDGRIESLKRFKDDVREVQQGYECGLMLEKFQDIKEGDIIEAYAMEAVQR